MHIYRLGKCVPNVALTGVGVSDLICLVGVQPDFLLPATEDAGGQPLLEPEHAEKNRNTGSEGRNYSRNISP